MSGVYLLLIIPHRSQSLNSHLKIMILVFDFCKYSYICKTLDLSGITIAIVVCRFLDDFSLKAVTRKRIIDFLDVDALQIRSPELAPQGGSADP